MTTLIAPTASEDLEGLAALEDASDHLFVDVYVPEVERASWHKAPSGATRAAEPGFILVARGRRGGPVIGFVHVLETEGLAHLEQLSVLPEHSRQGHGRALVMAALQEASDRGHHEITLRTYADVPFHAPFYATCGFEVSAPRTDFHRRLIDSERQSRLERYGRRVQMSAPLPVTPRRVFPRPDERP
ncbi:MAG: GNAT family N-acetyltransferase [Brachybacterium sp.]|nr:GNAT family N-acetyltransferase [Brachybacterium sp.]